MLVTMVTGLLASVGVAFYVGPRNPLVTIILLPFFVGAYWAYTIRSSLAVKLYRNQALGIGILGILYGIGGVVGSILTPANSVGSFLGNFLSALAYGFTLYWVDASMLAVRRADPLLRDAFKWTRTRFVFWPVVVTGLSFLTIAPLVPASALSPIEDVVASVFIYFSVVAPLVLGAVLLPVLARRSTDSSLARHLNWFALFAFTLVLLFARLLVPVITANGVSLAIAGILVFLVSAYCLYRSARALAPLNRVSELGLDRIERQ